MKRFKRVLSGTSAAVLSLSSLLTMGFTGVAHAAAQTCTWTGTAGDKKFSTATNWSNCGGGAPLAGDIVLFDAPSGSSTVDIDNTGITTALGGVKLTQADSSAYFSFALSDSLHLAENAVWTSAGGVSIVYVSTNTSAKTIAAGNLRIEGGYVPRLAMAGGVLTIGAGGLLGPMIDGTFVDGTVGRIVVENGGGLECLAHLSSPQSIATPITLGGGSGTALPTISFDTCRGSNGGTDSALTLTLADVTLASDVDVTVFGNDTVKITNLTDAGHTIKLASGSDGTLTTPQGTQTVVYETKTTQLDGDKPTENVTVNPNETAVLSGKRCDVLVKDKGILKGSGELCSLTVASGGAVAPGNSPGTITMAGELTLSGDSTYIAEVQNSSSYDKITANGVRVYDAILNLTFLSGATTAAGDAYILINNTHASDPVNGTFKDLPEGATFTASGGTFKITYKGGDGNDVAVTVVTAPTVPDTGFALISANPLLTLGATAGAAIVLVGMARKTRPAHARAHAARRRK